MNFHSQHDVRTTENNINKLWHKEYEELRAWANQKKETLIFTFFSLPRVESSRLRHIYNQHLTLI